MQNLKTEKTYKITNFIQDILDIRFKNDNITKRKIDFNHSDKIVFACPYCGDSKKNPNKKRGNLYLRTGSYKCFNDGCMKFTSIGEFIKHFINLYKLPIPDLNGISLNAKTVHQSKLDNDAYNIIEKSVSLKGLINISDIVNRFSMVNIKDLSDTSQAKQYIRSRALDKAFNFYETCYTNYDNSSIYIFNVHLKSGKVLGISERPIITNGRMKYKIINYRDLSNGIFDLRHMSKEDIEIIDHIGSYFNILNINLNEPITVTEGQFDSMFIRNAMSLTGVTKGTSLLNFLKETRDVRILFDADQAGLKESMNKLKSEYKVFMWSKMKHLLVTKYNDSIKEIKKIKDVNDLFLFLSKVDSEIDIFKFNEFIDTFYTSDVLDTFYL